VCNSTERELLYEQRFEDFQAGSITNGYDVVGCLACGTCFASGLPDEERFSEYYGQSSKYDLSAEGAEVSSFDVERYRAEAEFISTNVTDRDGPILDIGTATGELLVALRDLGFTTLCGVEPSPEAARRARDDYGLDVRTGDAGAAGMWDHGFAVICFVAVLEHLVDPVPALRDLTGLLRPDGALYLLVPDAARFDDHLHAPFQEFSVEHINYFTPVSFRNLLAAAGFEVFAERRSVVEVSHDASGPAIEVLCRRTTRPAGRSDDRAGVESVRSYIRASTAKEAAIQGKIGEIADSRRPIYVWGTGTNALHLLAVSRLGECNIVAFIDSNPHYSGHTLAGRTVVSPGQIDAVDAPILVASAVSQSAIAAAARETFGPDVALILMY
jgi:SAM-dependent methyltransferase